MRRKKINYDEIINKLDEYLKNKTEKHLFIVVYPSENGYKINESDGVKCKEFYINTDKELEDYLKENKKNKKCNVLNIEVIE